MIEILQAVSKFSQLPHNIQSGALSWIESIVKPILFKLSFNLLLTDSIEQIGAIVLNQLLSIGKNNSGFWTLFYPLHLKYSLIDNIHYLLHGSCWLFYFSYHVTTFCSHTSKFSMTIKFYGLKQIIEGAEELLYESKFGSNFVSF